MGWDVDVGDKVGLCLKVVCYLKIGNYEKVNKVD